jgi:hypothetical protein
MVKANGKVAKKLGGVTGKGFMPGRAANPGGRPRDINGFRERCRERTPEIIEVMEHVFFVGTWPPKFPNQRMHQVSDAVRMQAAIMLVSHGWGTPPASHHVQVSLPQLPPQHITKQMSQEEAARIYEATIRHGYFDDSGADPKLIDVTPNPPDPSGEDPTS